MPRDDRTAGKSRRVAAKHGAKAERPLRDVIQSLKIGPKWTYITMKVPTHKKTASLLKTQWTGESDETLRHAGQLVASVLQTETDGRKKQALRAALRYVKIANSLDAPKRTPVQ